jgi:hypothetical protein
MSSSALTGMALVALGLAGLFATGAATAVIPALFGLVLILLALRARNPRNTASSNTIAAGVAALGLLAALGNIVSRLVAGTLVANAAAFANVVMAALCALYLAIWAWELSQSRRGGMGR